MSDIIPLPLQELACIIEKARVLDMLANAGGLDASTVVDGEELAALLSGLSDDELTNVLALPRRNSRKYTTGTRQLAGNSTLPIWPTT